MYGLSKKDFTLLQNYLKNLDIKKAVIFGSRAKGNYKKGSDIDLAVIGDHKYLNYFLNEETTLPYFFDVINLQEIKNENLKEHIQRVGKVIYPQSVGCNELHR